MKLYRVDEGEKFAEYQAQRFKDKHLEEVIESWLAQNSDCVVEGGGLLIIGQQVTTNLGTTIDLLGVDRDGNVAVVELKRDRTPRDTLAQALEYASFAATLNGDQLEDIYRQYTGDENAALAEAHHEFFSLADSEAVTFNKDQVIVVVGTEVVQPIRQSAAYLRLKGLRVVCLEFSYFQAKSGERLLSMDTVVGAEPLGNGGEVRASLPRTNETAFLTACDDAGRAIFQPLLRLEQTDALPINWGSRGFSLSVEVGDSRLYYVYGYPKPATASQTPESLYFGFKDIAKFTDAPDLVERFRQRLLDTGLFVPAGRRSTVKYLIATPPTPVQVETLVAIVREVAREARALATAE